MAMTRLTVTVNEELAAKAREASGGNVSRFVSEAIEALLDAQRRARLREALRAGCIANAEEDLQICREWEAVDAEAAAMVDEW